MNVIMSDKTTEAYQSAIRKALNVIVEDFAEIKRQLPELSDNDCRRLVLQIAHSESEVMAAMIDRPLTDDECERVANQVYESQDYEPDIAAERWLAFATDQDYQQVLDGILEANDEQEEDDAED